MRAGAFGVPPGAVTVTTWLVLGYFALGIGLNAVLRSRPERLVMTPVCVVLTACTLVVAVA